MQSVTLYDYEDDETLHPLWLGILILIFVIILLGILCCLRIRFTPQLRALFSRTKTRDNQDKENIKNNAKKAPALDSYRWSSMDAYLEKPSKKSPVIIPSICITDSNDNVSVEPISHGENRIDNELNLRIDMNQYQMSLLPSIDNIQSSEIARKFYASIRNTTDTRNSISYESYESDSSIRSYNPTAISAERCKIKKDSKSKLIRKPSFFHTIPYTDGLALGL